MTFPDSERLVTPMTRPEIRICLSGWFCGCGSPSAAANALLLLLDMHPMYDGWDKLYEFTGGREDAAYLLLYTLDSHDLAEHGGSVGGQWLTKKGEALLSGLRREYDEDGFTALFDEDYCIHGISVDDHAHDCMKAGEPKAWSE